MKKVVFNLLAVAVAVLTTMTALTSCEDNPYGERELEGNTFGYEIFFADQTQSLGYSFQNGVGEFDFWETSIFEPEKSPWIVSVTLESGYITSAGTTNRFTFFTNVEPNTSGIDREGVILVKTSDRGRNEVLVTRHRILQKATTRDGALYKVPESQ
jgi:hypothetical protein